MRKFIILLILAVITAGCPWNYGYKYNTGVFPEYPVNLTSINSEYDDYNSTAPFIFYSQLFHFSSNRNSEGENFDIVGKDMYIDWSKDDGTLYIGTPTGDKIFNADMFNERYGYLTPMFDSVNTPFNELGPYSVGFRQDISYTEVLWTDLLMYASDEDGNFDIKFLYGELRNSSDTTTFRITPVYKIAFLNSEANDLYPSFYGEGFYYFDEWGQDPDKIEKMLYCSDRTGDFNIYQVEMPGDSSLIAKLRSVQPQESVELPVNSGADDKCPFMNGRLLVFASDREGGFGGYDLYYAVMRDDGWSEPKNFGERINTEYDEYRPITMGFHDFENTLMIFSSDRPGGLGGFDLYYVGISQGTE